MGLAGAFDRELCVGGVTGVGDFDIKEEREGIVEGAISVSLEIIVLVTGWPG